MRIVTNLIILTLTAMIILVGWHYTLQFNALDKRWWEWLIKAFIATEGRLNLKIYGPFLIGIFAFLAMLILSTLTYRATARVVGNPGRKTDDLHGSARWAKWKDVKLAALAGHAGVVIGGWKRFGRLPRVLRHDGPEHVMAFAPTRSGKGVSLIIPTLLEWQHSAIIFDIKGENYALTSGYRQSLGHRVLRFEPAALKGSVAFNPLAEIRIDTPHAIADSQNLANNIIDTSRMSGAKDSFWVFSAVELLAGLILHVVIRQRNDKGVLASLADVREFLAGSKDADYSDSEVRKEALNNRFAELIDYDHGDKALNDEVAAIGRKYSSMPHETRGGVIQNAVYQLSIFADPIVNRNLSTSDFALNDLMNGDKPVSLYMVVSPADIDRLKPIMRIILTQFLRRMTERMEFENGEHKKSYKHKMLLLLDELPALGKMEILESSLAFMAGYGIKAYLIIQDINQLRKEYGDKEALFANCHIRIAFATNNPDTAKILSQLSGEATIIQKKRNYSSANAGALFGSTSDSLNEVKRQLLTPGECQQLQGMVKVGKKMKAGDMLIFPAGSPPIYGQQTLFFHNKIWRERSKIAPPL